MELLSKASHAPSAIRRALPRRIGTGISPISFLAPVLCLLVFLSLGQYRAAAQAPPSEYDVKAAFLLNFTKFVEWQPDAFPDPRSPITICILGEDPFGRTLDQMLEGEVVSNRRLALRRVWDVQPPRTCQVLFLSTSERDIPQILRQIGPGALTVSERDDFVALGGMIQFILESRRVRFDINARAAAAARLRLSSQLLRVARSVR